MTQEKLKIVVLNWYCNNDVNFNMQLVQLRFVQITHTGGLSRSKPEFKFEHGQIRAHNDGGLRTGTRLHDEATRTERGRHHHLRFPEKQRRTHQGKKIFDVRFMVNNQKQIVETNYENNDVHAKPGVVLNPVKTAKD